MYTETRVMVTSLLLGGLEPTLPGLSGLFFVCTEGESNVRHEFCGIFLKFLGGMALFLGWGCLDYRELTGFLPDFVHDLTKIGIIGGEQC